MKNTLNKKRFKTLFTGFILTLVILTCVVLVGAGYNKEKGTKEAVVVLNNQQKEIQNSLSIGDIQSVDGFSPETWYSDTEIMGELKVDGIWQVAIYDIKTNTLKQVTKNKDIDPYEGYHLALQSINENYKNVIIKIHNLEKKESPYNNTFDIYMLNIETGESSYVDTNVQVVVNGGDQSVLYSKGTSIYRLNMNTGDSSLLELPEELNKKLNLFPSTYDKYLDLYEVAEEDRKDDYYKNNFKENYDFDKEHLGFYSLRIDKDVLNIRTFALKDFQYNLKTKEFTELPFFRLKQKETVYPSYYIDGPTQSITYEDGRRELWTLDEEGNKKELLCNEFANTDISPDQSKMVYRIRGDKTDEVIIYDFKTNKSVPLFNEIDSAVFWSKDSNSFYFLTSKGYMMNPDNITTHVVQLNQ